MYSWFLYDKIVDLRLVNNKLMIKSGAGLIDFNEYLELILWNIFITQLYYNP